MKQKRGISRYLLAMLLLLGIAITAGSCGGGGGGDGDGGGGGGGPTPTPPPAGSFDDGTLQGWTAEGLWHITSRRASSAPYSVWYGDETTGNFDVPPGTTHSGNLTSPAVTLGSNPVLRFNYFLESECQTDGVVCSYDNLTVHITNDGGATYTQLMIFADWTNGFASQAIDLLAYAGDTVQIRFKFDTGDEIDNALEGAYVDNVALSTIDGLTTVFTNTNTGLPVTIAGSFGAGKLVYNNLTATFDESAAADLVLKNALQFASGGGANWLVVGSTTTNITDAAAALGATVTTTTTFDTDNLVGTNLVIFTYNSAGDFTIGPANKAKLASYVSAGGGLYVEEGGGFPALDYSWMPHDGMVSALNSTNLISIAAPGHPIAAGVTDLELDNWGASSYGDFTTCPACGL